MKKIIALALALIMALSMASVAFAASTVAVGTADALIEALEAGNDVVFTDNIKIEPAKMSNAYGTTGINIKNGQAIDGAGFTLDIQGAGGTWDSGINTTGGVIKNLKVTGSFRGIFVNHTSSYSEKVILDNVVIDGTVYTISCDQGLNQNLEAINSTFKGWTSYATTIGEATFTNCFFGEGSGYAFMRPYAPTTYIGCEFEAGYTVDPVAAVTFQNCTLDGVKLTEENIAELVTDTDKVTVDASDEVKIPTSTNTETVTSGTIVSTSTTVTSGTAETLAESNMNMVIEAPVQTAAPEVNGSVVVTFDAAATETLAEMEETIEIVIEATTQEAAVEKGIISAAQAEAIAEEEVDVAVVLTADILVNGVEQSFVTEGAVEIEIPFAPTTGELTDYVVYFLNDNGTLAKVPTKYDTTTGALIVSLQHFSTYLVGSIPTCSCELASDHLAPGDVINLVNPTNKDYKVSYDFTSSTGGKNYSGASLVESVKWNKTAGAWQLTLKNHYSLSEERALKGQITFTGKGDNKGSVVTVDINETVCNHIQYVFGEKRVKDVTTTLDTSVAPLLIMDEDGGYVKFQEEMLSGIVKMNKEEKTFLNLIYGVDAKTEDTIDAIEEFLGEDYVDDAIIEYYTFETRAFKNDVDFSYEAYEEDPHYFYLWDDGKLTKIEAKYNDDEDVEAYEWTGLADGTIIVTDVEIVLAAETTKNPDTGANDVVGMASALAVVSLVAAGAISLKK